MTIIRVREYGITYIYNFHCLPHQKEPQFLVTQLCARISAFGAQAPKGKTSTRRKYEQYFHKQVKRTPANSQGQLIYIGKKLLTSTLAIDTYRVEVSKHEKLTAKRLGPFSIVKLVNVRYA